MAEPKTKFVWNAVVSEIQGGELVQQVRLKNTKDATISVLSVEGVFVAIGGDANTGYIEDASILDERGYVITSERMETELPGIFAAGDVRHNSIGQVVAATGDGAVAAVMAERF